MGELPICKTLDTSGEEFFLRVSSAQPNSRPPAPKRIWKHEEYHLISPKSPDPLIARSFHKMLSIQRSEETLMRTSRRLEYQEHNNLNGEELKESIVIFSPMRVAVKGKESKKGVQIKKSLGSPDSSKKPVFHPRKMPKNMKIGINRKLESNSQPLVFTSPATTENNYKEFPKNGLVKMPKINANLNETLNTDLNKRSPSELFQEMIHTTSITVNKKMKNSTPREGSPADERPITSPKAGFQHIRYKPGSPDSLRPNTTQSARSLHINANVPSTLGSYIKNKANIASLSNVHALDKKRHSPPHQKIESIENDYRLELFEKPFANDKVSVRNRYKIPRLLVNRKCSGRKLVSEFMDLKGLISVKDALEECHESVKKKQNKIDFDEEEAANFFANEAVREFKAKIQNLYGAKRGVPDQPNKRQHAHKSSSGSIKDYFL